jgi:hypothetical protein
MGELTPDLGDGHHRFEAAAAAAPAPVGGAGQLGVADLAGDPGRAAVGTPGQHDAGADAVRRLDVEEVVESPAGPVGAFAPGAHVGVVTDRDRMSEPPAEFGGRIEADPVGQDGGRPDDLGPYVERPGDSGGDAEHLRQLVT